MPQLTISQVARQVGLRPSAIRYYEQMKILPVPSRMSGQRRYDFAAVYQLTVLRRAQQAGFTLEGIRQLFFGFPKSTSLSTRWRRIAERKQVELDAQINRLQSMKDLLSRLQLRCECDTVSECGAEIRRSGFSGMGSTPLPINRPRSPGTRAHPS